MLALIMLALCALTPISNYAASSSVKANAYSCIKSGDYAYVTTYAKIKKVDLNSGEITNLVKTEGYNLDFLQKKGNYLYYGVYGSGLTFSLYRVNVKTGKKKCLEKNAAFGYVGENCSGYVIKGSKIYFNKANKDCSSSRRYKMDLNGKNKKKTSTKAKMKRKNSNKEGYALNIKQLSEEYSNEYYLKTPSGNIYLGKEVWS